MDFRHTGKEKQQIQLFPSNQNLLEMPGGPILIKQGNKETTEKIVKILKKWGRNSTFSLCKLI